MKPEGSLAVWGSYFGRESNRVDVKAAAAAPVTLRLEAAPASLAVGAAGRTKLSAQGGQGPVELIEDMTAYSSSDDRLLAVGKQTGAYRAMASGEATLTVSHPAAQQPATAKVTVTGPAAAPRGDVPVVVKIVSDQGPMVRFPVGAQFDDFRVEAEYADGVTRMVTKKATLRASQPADQAPLAPEGGRLVGVRPGQTTVQAEFEGVHSQKGLDAVVTAELDADEIRLAPSPATILPGETIALDAIGYKDGKSVGILTGFGRAIWKSSDEHVARNVGPAVTGVGLGQAAVTAQLGAVTSKPATVSVVDSIAEPLVIDPRQIHLLVGESRQIGVDLMVSRGAVDLSRQCTVTPALPDVVRYNPATHSLVGVSPGVSPVAFVWGDKVVNATVEVTGGVPLRGEVIVEPANAVLSPGQAVDLRVFVLDRDGRRVDYTDTAVLASSDPAKVSVRGNKASAMTPGTAVITATLPGNNEHGAALVSVNNEKLTALVVEPSSLAMSVGDHAQLKVLARSPTGAFELSPLAGLTATVEGPNPAAVKIFGATQLDALSAGQADVTLQLKDGLSQKVPVTVTADRLTDLQIEPNATTVQPGDRLVYQVTGTRGGRRRVLGSDDGVSLSVTQPDVAQATGGMSVLAARPGRTAVVAQVGNQQAEASLTVAGEEANVVLRDHLGRVVQRGLGQRVVLPDDVVLREGEVVVPGIGIGGGIDYAPTAGVVALRFVPQVLRLPLGSPGSSVRVVEVLADGSTGRDVTTDPAVQIDRPQEIATLDRTATGITVRPVKPGQTQIEARSGQLTAVPLLVDVGDSADAAAHLEATPDPLSLWSGESGALGSVRVVPSTGQTPFEANYRLSLLGAPGVVAVEGDRRLRGVAPGTATVQVTAVDLAAPYNGLSTVVQVQVGEAGRLSIEPGQLALQVGQATPRFSVVLHGAGGDTSEVSAVLDSTDPHVLAPDPQIPGRFIAKDYGGTQVRAVYRGHEALANVTISGKRFTSVNTSLNEGPDDFDVTIDVTADAAEGPLEYRVTAPGQPPPAAWQPAETAGDSRHVVLHSPRMQYRGPAAQYRLIIEARDPAGASTQQYPFTFRLVPKLERTDTPVGKPGMNTP